MNKIVIYTGAFGENYGFIPQKKIDGVDFFCFTDDETKIVSPWKPMKLKFDSNNEVLKNRHPKLLPHEYFKDYDISIYIDSNFLIIGNIHKLLDSLDDFKMATFDHSQSDDARNCIYKEYNAILELGKSRGVFKDDPDIMKKQIDSFKSEGYPENNGLIKGGLLIRKHNDSEVIKVMEDWWEMVSTRSKRDQLSFNYVAWKNNFTSKIIAGDLRRGNPYFYFLSAAQQNYSFKLLKYKVKRFFGIKKHP
ncbi:glycosyltransferase domain-containing protein [Tenacibaculum agarivorans]|uniref:glycosyltransferase domain-containing protein n=1 Tax=Tenacibaculum agarivorans TaxID=1908389 RepID=UPI00094B7DBE|nr:glycosyltransferase domain-containing protein [Tenacibaculum agarivorans]